MDVESLRSKVNAAGQGHLLQFWDDLAPQQQRELSDEIQRLDLDEVCGFFKRTTEAQSADQAKLDDRLQPVHSDDFGSVVRSSPEQLRLYENLGLEAVSRGQIGVLLLAGGQGTRLGVNYPKGMYDVGLPSHKSLYQLQAERLAHLQEVAADRTGRTGGACTWYIMASEATKQPTQRYFENNDYFGLDRKDLVFFEQGTLPCFTFDGKIILQTPSQLAHAPDGNGGLYRALKRENILEDMHARGIKYLHVYCVDNILVKMADPVFMGYCISRGADCGAKVVEKAFPTEPVGVVCQVDGRYQVVEYSEITLKTAQKRNADGRLTFAAGSICNHFFTIEFLESVVSEREAQLLHHMAKKKIPYADETGQTRKPDKPNGIKMEKFVFDVFQVANDFAVWEVLREDEFSPLKNADGAEKDTPTTARLALCSLHQRYVLAAGGQFVDELGEPIPLMPSPAAINGDEANNNEAQQAWLKGEEPIICEISPLVSYAGEGLEPLVKGKRLLPPLLLNEPHKPTNGHC
ncbi:UDP-N-acetylhexosamine pyrophosphorylase-like [Pollicipes pollicipes]|uniref:UDP-N-acetylhexosamine pyrophosphorylase-like n=1 Tax=Pollicipes pollicipes TaxID=41117 RepID=UPI0018857E12|nr:UDP-N-acetylhexosamine pyrophosphorylase-like [Pollicipes pollicipes]XP_037093481.1 UDP-N-acetylhexosamine pyrophosphorylase-like [Pollicipes pollicipes]